MIKDLTYTTTKSTVECYKLRSQHGSMYWADITIDAKEKTGRIQIASDFGSWQNYWGACGCPFKEFLTKLDMHYFAGKVGESQWFSSERTLSNFREHIKESDRLTKQEKKELFSEVNDLVDYIHENEFTQELFQKQKLMKFWDYCPNLSRDISPQFRKFWETVWQAFIGELKAEMAVNQSPVGAEGSTNS